MESSFMGSKKLTPIIVGKMALKRLLFVVSIFILRDQSDLKTISPLRSFTGEPRLHHIDLLLIYNEINSHYILIKKSKCSFK